MRVVGTNRIDKFVRSHSDAKEWFVAWLAEVRKADWQGLNDVKTRYRSASLLHDNKVVFNVKGNSYRMEVEISFRNKIVAIKRIGTHAEYDRWDM